MNSQGGDSMAYASGSSQKAPIRPLHASACYLISLTHTLLERITHMPFPIGTIIKFIETAIDRWTHPLTHSLERHGLYILGAIDDKICALGSFAEGCIFCTAAQLKAVLSLLYTQGLVGTSAGLWLKYEGTVTDDIQKVVCLANKVPLVNLVTPVVCTVSSPLARAISDWLLKQGGRVEKGTQTADSSLAILKQEVQIESPNTELEALSCIDVGAMLNMIVDDVHCGGKVVSEDDSVKDEGQNARIDELGKHHVHLSEKDMSVDKGETSAHDIIEEDMHVADSSLDDVNADEGVIAAGKTIERPLLSTHEADDYLPDVLEMIESSWLLGKASSLTKAPYPQQTSLISKPHGYGFKIKIKTLFCG